MEKKKVLLVVAGAIIFTLAVLQYTQLGPPLPRIWMLPSTQNAKQDEWSAVHNAARVPVASSFSAVSGVQVPTRHITPTPVTGTRLKPNLTLSPAVNKAESGSLEAELVPGDSHLPYEDPVVGVPSHPEDINTEPGPQNTTHPPLKKILFWNDAFGSKDFYYGLGREPFLLAKCRVNSCFATSNRTRFPPEEIDALLWHVRSNDKTFPTPRWPHTRYVFWLMESPAHVFADLVPYNKIFNWTMTYKVDSEFPLLYGRVYRRRHPLPEDHRNYAQGKTKMAAWFVSHCRTASGREMLVKTLQKWLKVDVYGRCGKLKCPRSEHKCIGMLKKDYKFYLSFENSLCKDYVTEKFFNMLSVDVVPVVYGLANYSALAPPHSYINALSFPSAKALADYLLYLHHNDTAYNEYFRWKRFHTVANGWDGTSRPYCDLCERLHSDDTTSTYDIHKWFITDSNCLTKKSSQIRRFIQGQAPLSVTAQET